MRTRRGGMRTRRGGKWYDKLFGSSKPKHAPTRRESVINNTSIDELTSGLHKTNSKLAKMQEDHEAKFERLKLSIDAQIAHVLKELDKKANISQVEDVDV
jgi:hypothetical protein